MQQPASILERVTGYLGDIQLALDRTRDMERWILEGRIWSDHIVKLSQMFLFDGAVALDIGANSGLVTLPMAKFVGPNGSVISFEPDPVSIEYFNSNVALNPDILARRIKLEALGLGEQPGSLFVYHDTLGGNAYLAPPNDPTYGHVGEAPREIPVTTLDAYVAKQPELFPRLDFLKVDVEGMEHLVFRGGRQTLECFKPVIVFETLLNCFPPEGIRAAGEILAELGYHLFGQLPDGKLVPAAFPNLAEDTLAIHADRISNYLDLLASTRRVGFPIGDLKGACLRVAAVADNKLLINIIDATPGLRCNLSFKGDGWLAIDVLSETKTESTAYKVNLAHRERDVLTPFIRYTDSCGAVYECLGATG